MGSSLKMTNLINYISSEHFCLLKVIVFSLISNMMPFSEMDKMKLSNIHLYICSARNEYIKFI